MRAITADTTLCLAACFGTDAQSWINLQSDYDLAVASDTMTAVLGRIRRYEPMHNWRTMERCTWLETKAKCYYNLLVITWDEAKRQANIAKHGVDFVGCDAIFDGPVLGEEDGREAYGEQRINVLGLLHGQIMHLTYTDDGEIMRAISLRQAEKPEVRRYVKTLFRR